MTNPAPVLAFPELENLEGGSSIRGQATHIGQMSRNSGAIVRWQIFVNVDVQNGGESTPRNHAVALHEIPLLRKRYGMSGTVEPRANWVSGIARAQGLTESACRDEEERLKKAYGDTFTEVYGGANGVQQTLWSKSLELTKAWNAMQNKCRDLDRRITVDDINRVIAIITPKEELSESLESIAINVEPGDGVGGSADLALLQHLINNDVPDEKANAFAAEVAKAGGIELSDDAWARVPGVGKHPAKRNRLVTIYREFAEPATV